MKMAVLPQEWDVRGGPDARRLSAARVIDYTELLLLRFNVYRAAEDFGAAAQAHCTEPGDEALRDKVRESGGSTARRSARCSPT